MYKDQSIDESVLSNVLNQHNEDELRVVAEQIVRDIKSGRVPDESITEAQYRLGLSFSDTTKIAQMVAVAVTPPGWEKTVKDLKNEPDVSNPHALVNWMEGKGYEPGGSKEAQASVLLKKESGLKSNLRKLRQQLNSYDHEDLDGMGKLLSCIEGVEKQLETKEKNREERKKKKEEKAQEQTQTEMETGMETEEPHEAEASVDLQAEPEPTEATVDLQAEPQPAEDPEELARQPEQAAEQMVEYKQAEAKLKQKIKEITAEYNNLLNLPGLQKQFRTGEPIVLEWLRTMEDKRALMERASEKFSLLLVEPKTKANAEAILNAFSQRLEQEMEEGVENADKFLKTLHGMTTSPKYQAVTKPTVRIGPTPKGLQEEPHIQAPSEIETESAYDAESAYESQSAYDLQADDDMFGAGALSAIKRQLTPLMEALDENMKNIIDLVDVAENQLAVA